MALLKPSTGTSYDEVPDVIPPVPAGIYDVECIEASVEENKNKNGHNLVTKWKLVTEGELNGRQLTSYNSTSMDTGIKRVFKSAGVQPMPDGGYNTDELKGKIAKVEVAPNTYKDASGVMKESSQIKGFLIPGDAGFDPQA